MRISFKNIGGVTNDLRFELKKGLNVIRAPNATGKTSFIRAFQTIILPDNELRKRGEFLNDFVDYGRVELSDENGNFSRTIRAGRQRDRLEVSGTPYWSDGNKVNLLTIAEPNNEFLNAILRGSSIEEYITRFSDVDVHKKLIKWIGEKIEENKRGLIRLDEQVSGLRELENQLAKKEKELKRSENEKQNLPKIGKGEIEQTKMERELQEKLNKSTEISVEIARLEDVIKNQERIIKDNENRKKDLTDSIQIFEKEHLKYKEEKERLSKEIYHLKTGLNDVEKEIDYYERLLKELKDLSVDWKTGGIKSGMCKTCQRPFSESQRQKLENEHRKELRVREKEIGQLKLKGDGLKGDLEDLDQEIDSYVDKKQEVGSLNTGVARAENEIKRCQKEITELTKTKTAISKEIARIETNIDKDKLRLMKRFSEIEGEIKKLEGGIENIKERIEDMSDVKATLEKFRKQGEFLERQKTYLTGRINEMKHSVRKRFNENIKEVYKLLGFRDFQEIEIDDMFRIIVIRQRGSQVKTQDLNRLSTSERLTLGVITMFAGMKEYIPDFPIFILDEITTSYDPVRFKKIINYLNENVPYVIVTTLAPQGETLKVEHSI